MQKSDLVKKGEADSLQKEKDKGSLLWGRPREERPKCEPAN